jgi:hypothetical protein
VSAKFFIGNNPKLPETHNEELQHIMYTVLGNAKDIPFSELTPRQKFAVIALIQTQNQLPPKKQEIEKSFLANLNAMIKKINDEFSNQNRWTNY